MGIDDQTSNFVVFVGNDGLLQEPLEGNVSERNSRRYHLLGAIGSDPGQAVAGTRRRGLGQEITKVVEDVSGCAYGVPIDHVRSGPLSAVHRWPSQTLSPCAVACDKAPLWWPIAARADPPVGRQCVLPVATEVQGCRAPK